jgi:hypothetical protein
MQINYYYSQVTIVSLSPWVNTYLTGISNIDQVLNIYTSGLFINTFNSLFCQYNSTDGLKYSQATIINGTNTINCTINKKNFSNNTDLIDIYLFLNYTTIYGIFQLSFSSNFKTFALINGKYLKLSK